MYCQALFLCVGGSTVCSAAEEGSIRVRCICRRYSDDLYFGSLDKHLPAKPVRRFDSASPPLWGKANRRPTTPAKRSTKRSTKRGSDRGTGGPVGQGCPTRAVRGEVRGGPTGDQSVRRRGPVADVWPQPSVGRFETGSSPQVLIASNDGSTWRARSQHDLPPTAPLPSGSVSPCSKTFGSSPG
jgi:hypothetical protein